MTELLTAAQMRAIEQAAIDCGEVTGLELMERAGRGVVEAVLEEWPEMATSPQRAVVLCGPGNNGGDGFVVARLLKERGWAVEVFLYGEVEKLPPDAKVNAERWLEMGGIGNLATSFTTLANCGPTAHLIVDAIFGTGLSRPLDKIFKEIFQTIFSSDGYLFELEGVEQRLVSVDIMSGICADSGRILGNYFPADLTVTFHREKIGHYLNPSEIFRGRDTGTRLASIGLSDKITMPDWLIDGISKGDASALSIAEKTPNIPRLRRGQVVNLAHPSFANKIPVGHKYSHGHALILSGLQTMSGAARLAARGALRIGAGLVTIGSPTEALAEHSAQLNAIMLSEIGDADALTEALSDTRINALCLGPGLGLDDRAKGLVEAALAIKENRIAPGTVVDADALTILSKEPDLFAQLHDRCVLTPHAGEFGRLFPDTAEKLAETPTKGPAYSKVDATREAAKRAGCVVLFKGPDTVIAAPDGRCAINSAHYDRAAPWLATAGSGDVLAGFITGLLARGFPPMQAAETAAWLHVECALKFGPGLIAEDIPEQLPSVFRDLGL